MDYQKSREELAEGISDGKPSDLHVPTALHHLANDVQALEGQFKALIQTARERENYFKGRLQGQSVAIEILYERIDEIGKAHSIFSKYIDARLKTILSTAPTGYICQRVQECVTHNNQALKRLQEENQGLKAEVIRLQNAGHSHE